MSILLVSLSHPYTWSTPHTREMAVLQFAQFASAVDAAFWQALATKKLDVLKLSEAPQDIHAYYTTGRPLASDSDEQQAVVVPARLCVPAQGLDNDDTRY